MAWNIQNILEPTAIKRLIVGELGYRWTGEAGFYDRLCPQSRDERAKRDLIKPVPGGFTQTHHIQFNGICDLSEVGIHARPTSRPPTEDELIEQDKRLVLDMKVTVYIPLEPSSVGNPKHVRPKLTVRVYGKNDRERLLLKTILDKLTAAIKSGGIGRYQPK